MYTSTFFIIKNLMYERGIQMNKLLIASFTVIALAGCSSEQDQAMVAAPAEQALVAAPAEQDAVTYDMVGKTFYNEFIPCTAGPDFNAE